MSESTPNFGLGPCRIISVTSRKHVDLTLEGPGMPNVQPEDPRGGETVACTLFNVEIDEEGNFMWEVWFMFQAPVESITHYWAANGLLPSRPV